MEEWKEWGNEGMEEWGYRLQLCSFVLRHSIVMLARAGRRVVLQRDGGPLYRGCNWGACHGGRFGRRVVAVP
jgi:hypothetical protein